MAKMAAEATVNEFNRVFDAHLAEEIAGCQIEGLPGIGQLPSVRLCQKETLDSRLYDTKPFITLTCRQQGFCILHY
jgi:hypothetical protein